MTRIYTPSEQLVIVRQGWPQAKHRLVSKLGRHGARIFDLALERGSTLGSEAYGDKSFHLGLDQLDREVEEELADAIWYECIYDAREKGLLK